MHTTPKTILHISADFPDAYNTHKTTAVASLVSHLEGYTNTVVSINRTPGVWGEKILSYQNGVLTLCYNALPKGLFWKQRLHTLAHVIKNFLHTHGIQPHLIMAHKLTVEGVVGYTLANMLHIPLVCVVQGKTDALLLKHHCSLQKTYQRTLRHSSLIFSYSAWMKNILEKHGPMKEHAFIPVPVAPLHNTMQPSIALHRNAFVTVFRFGFIKHKNIPRLLEAFKNIQKTHPCTLDIVGDGTPAQKKSLLKLIEKKGLQHCVQLKGHIPNADIPSFITPYTALVLPSTHETFGMVYTEALFAGIPVLFSKNRGIDGFLDPQEIGYACNPYDVQDIQQGLLHLLNHEKSLKEHIAHMQNTGKLHLFTPECVYKTFQEGLQRVLPR
jgi:glycosyltransferase involved in cell wall biosynthesis